MMYQTIFTVEQTGGSPFPIDMLRYSTCFPFGERDAAAITRSGEDGGPTGLTVTLIAHHLEHDTPRLAFTRWRLFGWEVDESSVRTQQYTEGEDETTPVEEPGAGGAVTEPPGVLGVDRPLS
jgi:hypothetical protein